MAIPIFGEHGNELAYAAVRARDGCIGAPRRSPSFSSNTWEYPVRRATGNYTYYVPISAEMVGQPLEAVVLLLNGGNAKLRCEAWLTAHPIPMAARELTLK